MQLHLPLTFQLLDEPDFAKLTPVQQHQFRDVVGYTGTLDDSLGLTKFFAVHDGRGKHVYDLHLFCSEDGEAFVAGTTKRVGGFAEGIASADFDTEALGLAFERALEAFLIAAQKRPIAAKKPVSAKPPAKRRAKKPR